jgi:hypothetical protein
MMDVLKQPERARAWTAAAEGHPTDWAQVFAGYAATTDWPGASFWRELVAAYPAAKVILTVRDSARWYDSMQRTVLESWRRNRTAGDAPWPPEDFRTMVRTVIEQRVFDSRAEDREHALGVYERHNADVRAEVPKDRLLVFEVTEGWQPLCEFLGVPAPDAPFPRENDSAAYAKRSATLGSGQPTR